MLMWFYKVNTQSGVALKSTNVQRSSRVLRIMKFRQKIKDGVYKCFVKSVDNSIFVHVK